MRNCRQYAIGGTKQLPYDPPSAGPALCAVLPNVALGADELAGLVCARASPPAVRGRVTAYATGLQAAFGVTDVLQVGAWGG